jgi:hypothetical protein
MEKAHDHYPAGQQRLRRVHEWFDGFRTLRFIHLLRDEFPDQPLIETLGRQFDIPGFGNPDVSAHQQVPVVLLDRIRRSGHAAVLGVGSLLTSL